MPKIRYQNVNLSAPKLAVIEQANAIIGEYAAAGYDLTLRQLYYQFVARDLLPNRQQEYKRLGDIVADGRLAGLIDWTAIVDRTRFVRQNSHWGSPADIIYSAAAGYATDKWRRQTFRPEVWIEKDALVGVISGACERLDVPYFSCRGYTSLSEVWSAAQRMQRHVSAGQTPVILHFGDHDPSGIDMTRDIGDRLALFLGQAVRVERLALNWDQVERFTPPPNPAKITDSRAAAYIARFGDESWELDALSPETLSSLVEAQVRSLIDEERWDADHLAEATDTRLLKKVYERWDEVKNLLADEEEG